MAINKAIDGAQLDADLESIADAIRAKGGTSAQLAFPAGFISAVQAFPSAISVEALAVNANGVYSASSGYAFDPVTVSVPNSYSAADAGKVVSGNALVAQTSSSVTENGTVDTTLINSLEVNVSGGGGGDHDAEDGIIARTLSGTYVNSRVTTIGNYAFTNCSSLTTVSFSAATMIGSYAFWNCKSLTTVSFPAATMIGDSAFTNCSSLTTVSFPSATKIGVYAFTNCSSLTTVSFPACTAMSSNAFNGCVKLSAASFPACTAMSSNAFNGCSELSIASFPQLAGPISAYVFSGCSSLKTVFFPKATSIASGAFQKCFSLSEVSFPEVKNIGRFAFSSCSILTKLYLMRSSVCALSGSDAFKDTPIAGVTTYTGGVYGSIYVPSSLAAAYKSATNWAYYSDRIVGV